MGLKVKPGVEFVTAPAGIAILQVVKSVSKVLNLDITITSGSDGEHSGPEDPHKYGNAYDFRSKDLKQSDKVRVLAMIMLQLGSNFYGFLEDPNGPNEHFHIQLRKGTQFDIEHFIDN